jgi:hypothetical protein
MTFSGTANFISKAAANKYYKSQGYDLAEVNRKIKDGEIFIGKPEVPKGMTLKVNREEGRYVLSGK